MTLAEWTLAALLHFAPPERHDGRPWADASREAAVLRYEGIRDAITSQCTTKPCASLLVALAVGESGLARDADIGPCYRIGGYRRRCDSGRAASVWQAQAYGVGPEGEPVTVARLFAERPLAAWVVLRTARASLARCKHLPVEQRLAGLGGGNCKPSKAATSRWHLWQTVQAWNPGGER